MSRRSNLCVALGLVVALVLGVGEDPGRPRRTLAAPLDAPLSAPDNSIVLEQFLSGVHHPIFMTHAGDGTNRLWIIEKEGRIWLFANGQLRPTPFLDISGLVSEGAEQGLLGLAFHPDYETNGRFFVYYTAKPPPGVGNNTLVEYHVMEGNPNIANPVPVRTLFSLPDDFVNHNGGMIAFGPDEYLYVAIGDEGGSGDPKENGQNTLSLYGKLLRLDVDNGGDPNFPPGYTYTIPSTNPFVGNAAYRPEIWAIGLRNPWRFSFDRQTGDIFVGDVGQLLWEEIDFLPAGVGGLNFGWDNREGAHCFNDPQMVGDCNAPGLTNPILEYGHNPECSVTGGYRYRGSKHPSLTGVYFYGDFCSGRIWKGIFNPGTSSWTSLEVLDTPHNITSFAEDESGELYMVAMSGEIMRIAPTPPVVPQQPCDSGERPRVMVRTTRTPSGPLQVNITATTNAKTPVNRLDRVEFTQIDNSLVTVGTQVDRDTPFSVPLPANSQTAQFTVRLKPGQARLTVRFNVHDACGPWGTFIGDGGRLPGP